MRMRFILHCLPISLPPPKHPSVPLVRPPVAQKWCYFTSEFPTSNPFPRQFAPYIGHSSASRKRKATDNANGTITRNKKQDECTSIELTSDMTSGEFVELVDETCGHGYADDDPHHSDRKSQYSKVRYEAVVV